MTSLAQWNPFRALERRDESFDDLVREFFGKGTAGDLMPPVDVAETDAEVTVKMAVPGVEKDKINISVDDHVLHVRGENRQETKEEKKNYYRQEIRYGSFARAVRLPAEVDGTKAAADLKNGMLSIKLPKSKNPKAQPIRIKAS